VGEKIKLLALSVRTQQVLTFVRILFASWVILSFSVRYVRQIMMTFDPIFACKELSEAPKADHIQLDSSILE